MLSFLKSLVSGGVPRIGVAEARALLDRGAAVLVDVREPGEVHASGKAQGAILAPLSRLRASADPGVPAGRTLILYCASGTRSALAGRLLRARGHADVRNLGSLGDWVAGGGAVEPA